MDFTRELNKSRPRGSLTLHDKHIYRVPTLINRDLFQMAKKRDCSFWRHKIAM